MNVAVVVLAAGASARLGEPKVLARIGARTVLEHLLEGALALGAQPLPLVITGAHHDEIDAFVRTRKLAVEVVRNSSWEQGRTGSVALAATTRPGFDLLVAPADVPLVEHRVFVSLRDAWAAAAQPPMGWLAPWIRPGIRPAAWHSDAAPGHRRLFGHPVLLGHDLAHQATSFGPDAPLRRLRDSASPRLAVEVDDAAILDDLDSPDDLARLRRRASGE